MKKIFFGLFLLLTHQGWTQINETRLQRDLEVFQKLLIKNLQEKDMLNGSWYYGATEETKAKFYPEYGVILELPGININSKLNNECSCEEEKNLTNSQSLATILKIMRYFVKDYGDLIIDLKPDQKIKLIYKTRKEYRYSASDNSSNLILEVEATKKDILAYRENKLTEEQVLNKILIKTNKSVSEESKEEYNILADLLQETMLTDQDDYFSYKKTKVSYFKGVGLNFTSEIYFVENGREHKKKGFTLYHGKDKFTYVDNYTGKVITEEECNEKRKDTIGRLIENRLKNYKENIDKNILLEVEKYTIRITENKDLEFYNDKNEKIPDGRWREEVKRLFDKSLEAEQKLKKIQTEEIVIQINKSLGGLDKKAREALINYGRTIRNLEKSEKIIWEIKVKYKFNIKANNLPKILEYTVAKSILDQYNAGKLTMDQAMSKVEVKIEL